MVNDRNNSNRNKEQEELLREGRKDDDRTTPFEQVGQKQEGNKELNDEAAAEQQLKEAMTERD